MRTSLLAAVAAGALATPALAQTTGPYAGIEGGILFPKDSKADVSVTDGLNTVTQDDAFRVDYKRGYDLDLIGGFDLGMVRLEAELGYKRAKADSITIDPALVDAYNDATGDGLTGDDLDVNGHASVLSAMGNALLDFDAGGFAVYGGGGLGVARVKAFGAKDSAMAYQLIAGVRMPISTNLDAGLKYRYFRTAKLHFADDIDTGGGVIGTDVHSRFSSHSLLASLIYNFGGSVAPPPPPPPPPAPAAVAPATQTCPDGSVILATDVCPLPPAPPPPPPPPTGERG
jgi:opacity protein-like surface antigen